MAVRLLVAVTDRDWFEHVRSRPALSEVNFWAPGAAPFRALEAGELMQTPCPALWLGRRFMREMGPPRSPTCDSGSLNIVALMLGCEKTFRLGAVSSLSPSFLTNATGFRCPQAGRVIS